MSTLPYEADRRQLNPTPHKTGSDAPRLTPPQSDRVPRRLVADLLYAQLVQPRSDAHNAIHTKLWSRHART